MNVVTGQDTIAAAFSRSDRRAALMPYLMGGFPTLDDSRAIGEAYAEGGADLVAGHHEPGGEAGLVAGDVGHGRDGDCHEHRADTGAGEQEAWEHVRGIRGAVGVRGEQQQARGHDDQPGEDEGARADPADDL